MRLAVKLLFSLLGSLPLAYTACAAASGTGLSHDAAIPQASVNASAAIRQYKLVQQTSYTGDPGGSQLTVVFDNPTAAGSVIWLVIGSARDDFSIPSVVPVVVDDRGNGYSFLGSVSEPNPTGSEWGQSYAANVAAGTRSINVNYGGFGDYRSVFAVEIAGVTANPLVGHNENNQKTTGFGVNTLGSGDIRVTTVPSIIVAVSTNQLQSSKPPYYPITGIGYNKVTTLVNYGRVGLDLSLFEYRIASTVGVVQGRFSPRGADNYFTLAAAFKSETSP